MLDLRHLELRRNEAAVLRISALTLATPSVLFPIGAGGAGKSSWLAGLAGSADVIVRGAATLDGQDILSATRRVSYLSQQARFAPAGPIAERLYAQTGQSVEVLERELRRLGRPAPLLSDVNSAALLSKSAQRFLAVMIALGPEWPLYLLDEPTADLDDWDIRIVRARIRELGRCACVIVTTHNRQDCLAIGGHVALVAGGVLQECTPTEEFFAAPNSAAGRLYVETGNCNLPRPVEQPQAGDGLWWLVPGLLAGMSRPGMLQDIELQARVLSASGVCHLVCLEERISYPREPLLAQGIALRHYPIADMAAPSFNQALDLCREFEHRIRANEGVVLHCRGGLGRTGTCLAVLLIWFGDSADLAVSKVREARALAIQSQAQLRFLHDFAERIQGWQSPSPQPKEFSNVT